MLRFLRLRRKRWYWALLLWLAITSFAYTVALPPTISLAQSPLRIGKIDIVWGKTETGSGTVSDFVSGSVQRQGGRDVNVDTACPTGKSCPYIEFAEPDVPNGMQGKRWVNGNAQQVSGGFGPLAAVNGGKEPTGRKVVNLGIDSPDEFKLVLISNTESTGTVVFEAYVRACVQRPFSSQWLSCTPYFIPTGFTITRRETELMPIDASTPQFGFSLNDGVKDKIAQIKDQFTSLSAATSGTTGSNVIPSVVPSKLSSKTKLTSKNSSIAKAATSAYGESSAMGPDGGNQACAYMVNKILKRSKGYTIGALPNYVPSVESALINGAGTRVSLKNAQAGDIVISKGQAHIGICLNNGCSQVLSNSSSRARFSWKSNANFDGNYDDEGGSSHIYHVK